MPTFPTPEPITASIEIVRGSLRLVASDRSDTVVEVGPRDPSRPSDVRAADAVRVEFHNGTLTVSAERRFVSLGGAVTVDIELPSRSRLQVSSASANTRADGEFGDSRFATASGDAVVGVIVGTIKADSASGAITVDSLTGDASVSTASGDVTVGRLAGDIKFRAASGSLSVWHLDGNVKAQTASGDVTVADAANGALSVQTASGDVGVGIPEGTAAQLDLRTHSGKVLNNLQPADGPAQGDKTLRVTVRTASGDISVARATANVAG